MNYSKYILIILTAYLLVRFTQEKAWQRRHAIDNDSGAYYSYLPAIFVKGDIGLVYLDKYEEDFRNMIEWSKWSYENATGNRALKMTCGVALMEAPFFFIGDFYAKHFGAERNGYSEPYLMAIYFSGLFYCILGLIVVRKLLILFFSDLVVLTTLCAIALGTNLFYYSIFEAVMSHAFSFFLISTFLYNTILYISNRTNKNFYVACFALGLAILVRPTNVIFAGFLLLYDVLSFNDIIARVKLFITKPSLLALGFVFFILPILVQLFYWRYVTGNWIYYSYGSEQFYFKNSHVLLSLFSYRKGWLVYTPIMVFAIFGIVVLFLKGNLRKLAVPILVIFSIYTFVVFSWWCWWYAGSFGQRPMVECYSLLSIPFAACVTVLYQKTTTKIFSVAIITVLITYNLFQSWQYSVGLIHYDSMSKRAYWSVFLKEAWPLDFNQIVESPDYNKTYLGLDEDLYTKK